MKTNLKDTEHAKASFDIIVDQETLKKAMNDAYKKARRTFNIPGFRKGKVPRQVIEAHYGKDIFLYDAIEELFPTVYSEAVDELGLDIMSRPSLTNQEVTDEGDLVLSVEVATLPIVTLPDYKEFTFDVALPEVTDEDIEAELEKQLETFPNKVRNTDTVSEDVVVELDLDSFLVDEEKTILVGREKGLNKGLNNLKSINNSVLEEKLAGKKVGDVITLDFDENGVPTEDAESMKRHDKVMITDIYVPEKPELNDDFVKSISFYETLDEYKEFLRDILENEKNQYFIINEYPKLLNNLLDNSTVEFSDLYTDEIKEELDRGENKLASFLQFIYDKTNPELSVEENYLNFVKDLSILEEVAAEMGYQITNDDLMKELDHLSQTSIIGSIFSQLEPTEGRMVLHYSALNRLIMSYLAQIATRNLEQAEAASEEA